MNRKIVIIIIKIIIIIVIIMIMIMIMIMIIIIIIIIVSTTKFSIVIGSPGAYCWFSHDITKFQTSELLILLRFYFHDVLELLKTNIQTNFHSEWILGLVIDYA